MIDWYLLLSPFLLLPIALLLVFVGCGLNVQGELSPQITLTVTDSQTNSSFPTNSFNGSSGTIKTHNPSSQQDTISIVVSTVAVSPVTIWQSPDGSTWGTMPLYPPNSNNPFTETLTLNKNDTSFYLIAVQGTDPPGPTNSNITTPAIEVIIPSGYNWNGTQCVPSTSGMGTYATLAACQAAHPSPPPPQLGPPIQTSSPPPAISGQTLSFTLSQPPINGNMLILTASTINGNGPSHLTISSISQAGVTWSPQVSTAYASPTPYVDVSIWAGVVGSGASTSITVNLSVPISSSGGAAIVNVCEFSGLLTSGFRDQTAINNSGSGTNASTGTVTTSHANELLIGAVAAWMSSSVTQSSPTNSFNLVGGANQPANGDDSSNAFLWKIVGLKSTYSTGTTIAISAWWAACIATFKAA